jgi:hypothetical protein
MLLFPVMAKILMGRQVGEITPHAIGFDGNIPIASRLP